MFLAEEGWCPKIGNPGIMKNLFERAKGNHERKSQD